MHRLKPIAAVLLAVGLLAWPETALNAAREAMASWAMNVAPALFPFMALMPMLTSAEYARIYEFLIGPVLRPVLNLPGSAAPAIVTGMLAGSPAGAMAAARTPGLSKSERERIARCVCGLSPAFLITGVGASMLDSAAAGRILFRSQMISQLILLTLTRRTHPDAPDVPHVPENSGAVTAILNVCGYMMLFSTAAALLTRFVGSEILGTALLSVMDLPSGARALTRLKAGQDVKLLLISAATGFGGLCIAMQNLAVCPGSVVKYLVARIASAAIMTGATAIQLRLIPNFQAKPLPILPSAALPAALLLLPAVIFWNKNPFLNKSQRTKNRDFLT